MKTVSCIIPIYGLNKGHNIKYFKIQLSSLYSSLKLCKNFEIIIVNDDKTNITRFQIYSIFQSINLINYLVYEENDKNRGQAYSRNKGAAIAKFDYLFFIDQDDYVSNNFFEDFISDKKCEDLYISKPYFNICGNKIVKAYTPLLFLTYMVNRRLKKIWFLLASNVAYSPGQAIFDKKFFLAIGGFPVLNNKGSDDYGLFYQLVFQNDLKYKFMKDSIFYYRVHNQQNSKSCNMDASVSEFLHSCKPHDLKEKIIHSIKLNARLSFFNKLFYVFFFKRAK